MPPGELPASLVAGKSSGRPSVNTSGFGGSYQNNTPTTPEDSLIPFDSTSARTGGPSSPGTQEDGRAGRTLPPDQRGYLDRSRPNGRPHTKSPGSSSRVCHKCGDPLTGQFVRALGATFHLECFKCEVSREALPSGI